MTSDNHQTGRRSRQGLRERYPDFPYTDLSSADMDEVDAKVIAFARNVQDALDEFQANGWATSLRDFARKVGLNHATLIGILQGRTYPDAETIALLEVGTQRPLWERTAKLRSDRRPHAFRPKIDATLGQHSGSEPSDGAL